MGLDFFRLNPMKNFFWLLCLATKKVQEKLGNFLNSSFSNLFFIFISLIWNFGIFFLGFGYFGNF